MYVSLHKSTLHLGARQAVLVSFLEPQFGTKPYIHGQVSVTERPYYAVSFLLYKMLFFTGQNHHFIHIMRGIHENTMYLWNFLWKYKENERIFVKKLVPRKRIMHTYVAHSVTPPLDRCVTKKKGPQCVRNIYTVRSYLSFPHVFLFTFCAVRNGVFPENLAL